MPPALRILTPTIKPQPSRYNGNPGSLPLRFAEGAAFLYLL